MELTAIVLPILNLTLQWIPVQVIFYLTNYLLIKIILYFNKACSIHCDTCLTTACSSCLGNRNINGINCDCPPNTQSDSTMDTCPGYF